MEIPYRNIKFAAPERLIPVRKPRDWRQNQRAGERTGVTIAQKPTRVMGRC